MRLGETAICKSEDITYRELDGEGILYNDVNKNMYVLNKTALAVWNLCDNSETPQQIANIIAEKYGISEDIVANDVMNCLRKFEDLGLIRRVSS